MNRIEPVPEFSSVFPRKRSASPVIDNMRDDVSYCQHMNTPTTTTNRTPTKFRYYAGSLIMLLLALGMGGYSVYQHYRETHRPPVIEHHLQGTSPRGIAPAPEFALRQRALLALTPEQVQHITRLAAAYRREIAPVQRRLKSAAEIYQKFLERESASARPQITEIETRGADVRQLSGVLVTTRHAYWQQVRALLTPVQQQRLDEQIKKARLDELQ